MLLVSLAVFGALAAIIWRSWIAGSVVLLFILMFFGLYFVRSAAPTAPSMVMTQETVTPAIRRWEPDPEMLKSADVYPSLDEAVKNLSLRISENIQNELPAAPKFIRVITPKADNSREICKQVFGERFPNAEVLFDNSHSNDAEELVVSISIAGDDKRKCVTLTARQRGRGFPQADACVHPAPWVDNFEEYRAENIKTDLVTGWSSTPETNVEVARHQAREDAIANMLPYFTGKYPELNAPNVDQDALRRNIEKEYFRHHVVKDEFVQFLRTPVTGVGVYRVGLLVDVSPSQLQKLNGSVVAQYRHETQRVRRFGAGVGGMALVICLVYLFLNRATRVYFQMNLRLAAFLVLVAGVLVMMMIG
jgi:hypothetical protein